MITVILFVILALVTGSSLALLQGYLQMSKEAKEKELLRKDIDEAVQKVKALIAKRESKNYGVILSNYERNILEPEYLILNLSYQYGSLKDRIIPLSDYNYVKKSSKSSINSPKTNGVFI